MTAKRGAEALVLHEDRFFDSDLTVRRIARELFAETRSLPIVSPHGHVDPRIIADDVAFPDPTSLLVAPDHYILRMLYARGVSLESLGVAPRDGGPFEGDPRRVWERFAEHYHLFRGTPTGAWLDYQLYELFGVRLRLAKETAGRIYDQILERLSEPACRPRALFERFNIEVLATTDAASDSLEHHAAIARLDWKGRVIPCFRPDAALRIAAPGWRDEIDRLAGAVHHPVNSYASLIGALEARRAFFKQMGATATDHAVVEPFTEALAPEAGEALFRRAVAGTATAADQRAFEGGMLMEMARMSVADGLVMQIHAGSFRDHNRAVADRFGSDRGGDIPRDDGVHAQPAPAVERLRQRLAIHAHPFHPRRVDVQPGIGAAGGALPRGSARRSVVVPRLGRGDDAIPRAHDGNRRSPQHRRIQRRYAGILFDSGAS